MLMEMFLLTEGQRVTSMTLDSAPLAGIDPRAIDAVSPGTGTNINGLADGYAVDDVIPLTGLFIAPYRIVMNADYIHYAPLLVEFLLTLPVATLDPDVIFAPPEE